MNSRITAPLAAGLLVLLSALALSSANASIIQYSVVLNGPSESPVNASPGTGTGLITFDSVAGTMRVQISFAGLTGTTTASHIHCCTAVPGAGTIGVATELPLFTGFPTGVSAGSYDHTFDTTLAGTFSAGFITANGGSPAGALTALLAGSTAGRAYLNIHSSTFAGGEIRGFLAVVPEPATLSLLGLGLLGLGIGRRKALA